ncbi:indolepyruvate oxidoreductase subunit beta [Thermoclostridium caenicola]|uniref:Indolepyruvate ferredoxin oxidoreductase beta subunit n=1 Tax=Thermoclostridium caenicola TaxID=659425 RepID=A0A1M6DE87_9FIRM|nr:indolepyruvate oxidoreductase subunit beta [Thermoclostridium caenicola]SHI71298.1 indolepyruvate ferredoxin oxidoreductase beta subunit [Thermoclostridium caenicola]HOP72392.1 indolepyruvate oxidoreductase subunit beta [Thermoclostridium caenicola]
MKTDVLIAGVGGQGQVLASRLIGAAAILEGYAVRTGETIGMSQRGGSVVSHVRIGGESLAATVPFGQADLLIGFELCEAVRNLKRLSKKGRLIVNTQRINPVTVSLGMEQYDAGAMEETLKRAAQDAIFLDGYSLAREAGSVKAVNVVLLGTAVGAGYLPLSRESFLQAIRDILPQKLHDLNFAAFDKGYELGNRAVEDKTAQIK